MLSIEQMREKIKEVYPGPKWIERVDKMSDDQVRVIYKRFLYENKF